MASNPFTYGNPISGSAVTGLSLPAPMADKAGLKPDRQVMASALILVESHKTLLAECGLVLITAVSASMTTAGGNNFNDKWLSGTLHVSLFTHHATGDLACSTNPS